MSCLVCDRIKAIREGSNPYYVTELETGYVVIGDSQFFRGYTLFLCKQHVPELHMLQPAFKRKFLEEMTLVAEAVWNWVRPVTLNYEALGNAEPHLHWHIFPRHADDPLPRKPVWLVPRERVMAQSSLPDEATLAQYRRELHHEIEQLRNYQVSDVTMSARNLL